VRNFYRVIYHLSLQTKSAMKVS